MMCVALKDFTGAGEDYVRNQLVDASVFRNQDVLIKTRYLRPATEMEIKTARRVDPVQETARPRKKTLTLKRRQTARA